MYEVVYIEKFSIMSEVVYIEKFSIMYEVRFKNILWNRYNTLHNLSLHFYEAVKNVKVIRKYGCFYLEQCARPPIRELLLSEVDLLIKSTRVLKM